MPIEEGDPGPAPGVFYHEKRRGDGCLPALSACASAIVRMLKQAGAKP
jgi:hypothetical protein